MAGKLSLCDASEGWLRVRKDSTSADGGGEVLRPSLRRGQGSASECAHLGAPLRLTVCRPVLDNRAGGASVMRTLIALQGEFGVEVSSYLFRWAHAKPSTEAAAYVNGPMRYHRQQEQHIPMGPRETIGNNSCIFNGPKRSYRQHLLGN